MEKVMILIAYIAIGCFVNGLVNEPWQKPSLLLVFLWPVLILACILIWFMSVMYSMGEGITKKMWKNGKDDSEI